MQHDKSVVVLVCSLPSVSLHNRDVSVIMFTIILYRRIIGSIHPATIDRSLFIVWYTFNIMRYAVMRQECKRWIVVGPHIESLFKFWTAEDWIQFWKANLYWLKF